MSNVMNQIKELEKKRADLLEGAKAEALSKINKSIEELNELGFNYSLIDGRAKKRKSTTHTPKDAPCPICKFKTTPPHDARSHRSQGDDKKPFTSNELQELGFTKV